MKVTIPRIVRPVRLSDYADEYGDQVVWMWVNPPKRRKAEYGNFADRHTATLEQIEELTKPLVEDGGEGVGPEKEAEIADALAPLFARLEELSAEFYAWWAEMWSQHEDESTHWTVEEVTELATTAAEYDPGFWEFLQECSSAAVKDYREQKKRS